MANLLGIDIGPTSVRGVLVKTQLRRFQLAQYLEVPLEAESAPLPDTEGGPSEAAGVDAAPGAPTVGPAEATRSTPLARALGELVRQAGGEAVDIIATLPGDLVSLRRVDLPKAAEKKIDELLPFELESVLPFEIGDTLLDHQPIEATATELHLLVSAAPKARIREELARLAESGADPVELVPAPAALAGLAAFVPTLASDGPHIVIVLGAHATDVCVLRKGKAELARTLSVGRAQLTRPDGFGSPGAMPFAGTGGRIETEGAVRFGRELKQTLMAHRMQGGAEPESIAVGGDVEIPGLFEFLSEHLGRSVVPIAMPEVVSTARQPVASPEPAARLHFATALGAVGHTLGRGKHLDFRKGEFVKKRDLGVLRDLGPLFAIGGAAVACAFFFSIYARWSVLDGRRELLEAELSRVTAASLGEETRDPARARALLETGRRSSDPMPAFTAYDAMVAVSGAVPEGVAHDLSRLSIDLGDARSGGHLEIQGTVGRVEDAERISQALGEVPCFRSLELGPATTTADGRRTYRIEADILCPGATGAESGRSRRRRGGDEGRERTGGEG
jgi:general secretion pathway protein L